MESGFEYICCAHLCLPETAFFLYLPELKNPLTIARGTEYENLDTDKVGTLLSVFANPSFFFSLSPPVEIRSLGTLHEQTSSDYTVLKSSLVITMPGSLEYFCSPLALMKYVPFTSGENL